MIVLKLIYSLFNSQIVATFSVVGHEVRAEFPSLQITLDALLILQLFSSIQPCPNAKVKAQIIWLK